MTKVIHFGGVEVDEVFREVQECLDIERFGDAHRVLLEYRDVLAEGRAQIPMVAPVTVTNNPVFNATIAGAIIDGVGVDNAPEWVAEFRLPEMVEIDAMWTKMETDGWGTTPEAWKMMNIKIAKVDVTNL